MSLTPFSRWENLGSRAYLIQSGSLSHPQAESNLNPGILTLNPMFFVPHSSNQSSQLTAYSDTQAKSALHLRSSTRLVASGVTVGEKGTYVLFNFISEHNWDRGWFRSNLKPTTKTKYVLSIVTRKIGLKTAWPFRPPFTSTTRIYH